MGGDDHAVHRQTGGVTGGEHLGLIHPAVHLDPGETGGLQLLEGLGEAGAAPLLRVPAGSRAVHIALAEGALGGRRAGDRGGGEGWQGGGGGGGLEEGAALHR
jgi:hypothetical protein